VTGTFVGLFWKVEVLYSWRVGLLTSLGLMSDSWNVAQLVRALLAEQWTL